MRCIIEVNSDKGAMNLANRIDSRWTGTLRLTYTDGMTSDR